MASPVVAGTAESSTPTAGTNHVLSWTGLGTVAANDLLLIIMDIGSVAATLNAHADYTELLDENLANGLKILYRWATGGETAPTFVSSASTRSAEVTYRITGAVDPATQAPQIGTTSTGTSATPAPPASATPPSSKDYLFIAFAGMAGEEADDDTWGNTPPTNYTPSPPRQKACGVAGTNLGGKILSAERELTTGVEEDPSTFGVDVSAAWRAQTITVHPAASILVTPTTASLVLTGFASTVTVSNNVSVTPTTASLVLTAYAPTVTATANVSVTPTTASLVLTGYAPTVSVATDTRVTPTTASLVLTGYAPTITVSVNVLVTPGTASLVLTSYAPTILLYTSYGGPFLWTAANWGAVNVYLEVYVRATTGTVYARLHDGTDVVANSEVSTTQATFQRLRSAALTLTDTKVYRVQCGKATGDAGELLSSRLVVIPA